MSNTNKSGVETTWDALAKQYGDDRTWYQLTRQQQDIIIQSINMILAVVHKQV